MVKKVSIQIKASGPEGSISFSATVSEFSKFYLADLIWFGREMYKDVFKKFPKEFNIVYL